MEMPSIFQPIELRSGSRYRSLQNHFFSIAEKLWVCKQVIGPFVCFSADLAPVIADLSDRYSIDYDAVESWINMYTSGYELSAGGAASVRPVDVIGMANIEEFLKCGRLDSESAGQYEDRWCELVEKEMRNSLMRR